MYFLDRMDLGDKLSGRLIDLKGSEAVILVLNENSITSCVALAARINAWVYPLLTEKVYLPGDPRLIGVINDGGSLIWNPEFSQPYRDEIEMNFRSVLDDAKRVAFSSLNKRTSLYGTFSKDSLNGRVLILTGDIVRERMEMSAAIEYIKEVRYDKLYASGGNVDPESATFMRIQADQDFQLDILSNMFEDGHYFERQNSYTADESRQILINISQFWT